jgi:hypothetical protein
MHEWVKKRYKICFYAFVSIQTVTCIDTSQFFWSMYRSIRHVSKHRQHSVFTNALCIDTGLYVSIQVSFIWKNWSFEKITDMYPCKIYCIDSKYIIFNFSQVTWIYKFKIIFRWLSINTYERCTYNHNGTYTYMWTKAIPKHILTWEHMSNYKCMINEIT